MSFPNSAQAQVRRPFSRALKADQKRGKKARWHKTYSSIGRIPRHFNGKCSHDESRLAINEENTSAGAHFQQSALFDVNQGRRGLHLSLRPVNGQKNLRAASSAAVDNRRYCVVGDFSTSYPEHTVATDKPSRITTSLGGATRTSVTQGGRRDRIWTQWHVQLRLQDHLQAHSTERRKLLVHSRALMAKGFPAESVSHTK